MRTKKPPAGTDRIDGEESTIPRYSVLVRWSEADGGFVATVAELPGVSAVGDTAEDAVREVGFAIEACVESLRDMGKPVPEPLHNGEYSGQLRLRMPRSLHRALADQAEQEGVSLNTHLLNLLSARAEEMQSGRYIERLVQSVEAAAAMPALPQPMNYRHTPHGSMGTSSARPLRVQEPSTAKRCSASRRKKGS